MNETLLNLKSRKEDAHTFADRKTAKAIVYNDNGEILIFPHSLIGGGLENGETYEDALHREVLEEAGIQIEIEKYIGEAIVFHDMLRQRYVVHGYLCKYINKVAEAVDELDHPPYWENPKISIQRIQENLDALKNNPIDIADEKEYELYESRVNNREIALAFLREVFQKEN